MKQGMFSVQMYGVCIHTAPYSYCLLICYIMEYTLLDFSHSQWGMKSTNGEHYLYTSHIDNNILRLEFPIKIFQTPEDRSIYMYQIKVTFWTDKYKIKSLQSSF